MPLYVYECETCGHTVEHLQNLGANPTMLCPCGETMTRGVSAPAIQFKGAGFYVTDYARPQPKQGDE